MSKVKCPSCGGVCTIEIRKTPISARYRVCTELVEVHRDMPLDACTYEEQVHKNGKPVK